MERPPQHKSPIRKPHRDKLLVKKPLEHNQSLDREAKLQLQQRPLGVVPPLLELPPLGITPPEGHILGENSCLGQESLHHSEQLAQFIRHELLLRQSILNLASEIPIWSGILIDTATGNFYNASLLASAYYYITEQIYWPQVLPIVFVRGTADTELLRLVDATAQLKETYTNLVQVVDDPCLSLLYGALASNKTHQIEIMKRIGE